MSFGISYKVHGTSPTLFSNSTTMAYSHSYAVPKRSDPVKQSQYQSSQMISSKKEQKQKSAPKRNSYHSLKSKNRKQRTYKTASVYSTSSRKSGGSVFDAISLIDTYMYEASIMNFSIQEDDNDDAISENTNPFAPLPDINDRKYQKVIEESSNDDYLSIMDSIKEDLRSENWNDKDNRKSMISKVFSEDELLKLSDLMSNLFDSNPILEEKDFKGEDYRGELLDKWDENCPTKVNGTPDLNSKIESFDKTYTYDNGIDSGTDFQIPIGVDTTPRIDESTHVEEFEEFSRFVDKHFSGQTNLTADIDNDDNKTIISVKYSKVLKKIRKIHQKINFEVNEIELIKNSWNAIMYNSPSLNLISVNDENINTNKNSSSYFFTKQFYNNLFRQVSYIKGFFPHSTRGEVIEFGNILCDSIKLLNNKKELKKYLKKNNHINKLANIPGGDSCSNTIFGYNPIKIENNQLYFSIFGKVLLRTLNENYPFEFNLELETCWLKFYQYLFSCIVGGLNEPVRAVSNLTMNIDHEVISRSTTLGILLEEDVVNNIDNSDNEGIVHTTKEESEEEESEEDDEEEVEEEEEEEEEEDSISNKRKSSTVSTSEVPISCAAYTTIPSTSANSSPKLLKSPLSPSARKTKRFGGFKKDDSDNTKSLNRWKFIRSPTSSSINDELLTTEPAVYVTNGRNIDRHLRRRQNSLSIDEVKLLNKLKAFKDAVLKNSKFFKKSQDPPIANLTKTSQSAPTTPRSYPQLVPEGYRYQPLTPVSSNYATLKESLHKNPKLNLEAVKNPFYSVGNNRPISIHSTSPTLLEFQPQLRSIFVNGKF